MKRERIFWGIFFILCGVALIVGKLGMFGTVNFWTMLLSIALIATMIKSVMGKNVPGVLFSIAFLCIVNAEILGITAITPWPVLGAALLGSIGISFLYHPKKEYRGKFYLSGNRNPVNTETVEGDILNLETCFAGSAKYINSSDFRGANIDCSFGDMKVYFDNTVMAQSTAQIKVDVSFGGLELYVPRDWNVENGISAFFGGVEEKGRCIGGGNFTLRLTGEVSFGGVTIIYV